MSWRNDTLLSRRSTYKVACEFIADLYQQEEGCSPLSYPIPVGANVWADLDYERGHMRGRTEIVEFGAGSMLYQVARQTFIDSTRPTHASDEIAKVVKIEIEVHETSTGYVPRGHAEWEPDHGKGFECGRAFPTIEAAVAAGIESGKRCLEVGGRTLRTLDKSAFKPANGLDAEAECGRVPPSLLE